MGRRKGTIVAVLICLFLLGTMSGVVFALSGNWVEVVRFTGTSGEVPNTESFTCEYVDWRIRWDCTPRKDGLTAFTIDVQTNDVSNQQVIKFSKNRTQLLKEGNFGKLKKMVLFMLMSIKEHPI